MVKQRPRFAGGLAMRGVLIKTIHLAGSENCW